MRARDVWSSQDGMVFVYFAVLLPVLIFLAALVTDAGYAAFTRLKAQTAADAAAFGGRIALQAGEDVAAAAKAVAALNGFDSVTTADPSLTISVRCNVTGQCPDGAIQAPTDNSYASYASDNNAVQVVVQKTNRSTFAQLLGFPQIAVAAWSVATAMNLNADTYCILGLGQGPNAGSSSTCSTGAAVCGNGNIDFGFKGTKCGVAANSADAVGNGGKCKSGVGSADFRGASANVWGPFYSCGGANAKTSIFQATYVTDPSPALPIPDPYASNGQKAWLMGLSALNVATTTGSVALSTYLESIGPASPSDPGSCGLYRSFSTISCSCGKKCTPPDMPPFSTGTSCYRNMASPVDVAVNTTSCPANAYVISGAMSGRSITGSANSVFQIASMTGGALSGAATSSFNIGSVAFSSAASSNKFGPGVYNINSMDASNAQPGTTFDSTGTYVINSLTKAPAGFFNQGTFFVNDMDAASLAEFNKMRTNCAKISYAPSTAVRSGTLDGCGRYSIASLNGGTLDGANGGLFLIGDIAGGTLRNGVFYAYSLSGSVTTTNATLVVFNSLNGWSSSSIAGPTGNTAPVSGSAAAAFDGAPKNAGFALTSPNGVQFTKAGNDSFQLQGAIYLPGSGSEFHLQGTTSISWSCGQLIAGVVELGGNAGMNVDNSCGVTQVTGNAHGARLVQ